MYRFMYCKTLNALGEIGEIDFVDVHDLVICLVNFRNKDCEKLCAGYSVYEIAEDGSLGKTLLNWQHDGQNIFGHIADPECPCCFFAA